MGADQDPGDYKCEGVYDTVFDDMDTTFDISLYEVKSSGTSDDGVLVLKVVSAITEPKLVDQDSSVSFTVYARDTPGRGKYENVEYVWQIKGNVDEDVDFEKYKDSLEKSNDDRTLTVKDLTKHRDHEFHCKVKRKITGETNPDPLTSDPLGVPTDAVVIAPKVLSIPMTSRTCENFGDTLIAKPNKAYMMPNAFLAGDNAKQILLKADSWKYYLNEYKVMFISDNPAGNFDNETAAGVTQEQFKKKLPSNENDRCVYWQYLRGYSKQYQLLEVMKTDRIKANGDKKGCAAVDFAFTTGKLTMEKSSSQVVVTAKDGTTIPTAQGIKMDLLDSTDKVLDSKWISPVADSCVGRKFPTTVTFEVKAKRKRRSESNTEVYNIKIYSDTDRENAVDPIIKKCSKPEDISNIASIAPDSAEIKVGDNYTIKCSPNFVPKKAELMCGEDGTLSPSAECITGTCPKPGLTVNVESISPDIVDAGQRFTVKCKTGYVPEPLTCQTDGTVSSLDSEPKCTAEPNPEPSTGGAKTEIIIIVLVIVVAVLVIIVAVVLIRRRNAQASCRKSESEGNVEKIDLEEKAGQGDVVIENKSAGAEEQTTET